MKHVLLIALLCSSVIAGDPPKPPFKAGQVRDDNGLEMKLVWCPPGKYTTTRGKKNVPTVIQVKAGFWIGKFEVTQKEWKSIARTGPWNEHKGASVAIGDQLPAVGMYAEESTEFVASMNSTEKAERRLQPGWEYAIPNDDEWEYACRAGSAGSYCFGNNVGDLKDYAWYGIWAEFGPRRLAPGARAVGEKLPNKWGIHDMHGNIDELCLIGNGSERKYTKRGGNWMNQAESSRCIATVPYRCVKGSEKNGEDRRNAPGLRVVLARARRK